MKSTRPQITVLKNEAGMDSANVLQFTFSNWFPAMFGADIRRCLFLNRQFLK